MNTTPPPPPPPPDRGPPRLFRLRTLGADVIDLVLVAASGTAAGAVTYTLLEVDDPAGFENLGVLFLALLVGGAVALLVAILQLVTTARGGSPGDRLVSRRHDGGSSEVGWRVARWFAVPLALTAAGGAVAAASEPGVASVVWPPLAGGLALGILALAYVDVADDRWLRAVAVAAALGVVLGAVTTAAIPSRDLYGFELRARATASAPGVLTRMGATRVCRAQGIAEVPTASHGTEPCFDPDAVWQVPGSAAAVAEQFARDLEEASTTPIDVVVTATRTHTTEDAFELRLASSSTIAFVASTSCGTRVRLGGSGNHPLRDSRFLPDRGLTGRCA